MSGLRILFLTPRFPYPLIGGDRIKSYNLLRHLARHHEVHLVSFNHGGTPNAEQLRKLEELGVRVHAVPLNPLRAGLRTLTSLYSDRPLEVAFYTQPQFHNVVRKLTTSLRFDLGISFFMRTAEYLKDIPIRKVLVAEDCRALYQSRSKDSSPSFMQQAVRWWEVMKLKRYEPNIVKHFDVTTFVTKTDIDALARWNGGVQYRLLTNGVDLDEYVFRVDQSERQGILFFGKLNVWANQLMVRRIAERIVPLVRQTMPDVVCSVVGAQPGKLIQRYGGSKFQFHADVPDIKKFVYRAAVFLHPHIGASGIQNKVLQAMSLGCPVVTTPTGVQGIEAIHGKHAMIGTTDQELAEHCRLLLNTPELRADLARNARALIERNHSWELIFAKMDEIIDLVIDQDATKEHSTS